MIGKKFFDELSAKLGDTIDNSPVKEVEKNVKAMTDFASKQFCPYGGIAQQYLFYYITHKNGL